MFYGWYVVGCAFVIALCGFGYGFYGPGLYLALLTLAHGWPVALVSSAVALYYLCAAIWTIFIGDALGRFGPRRVVVGGALAMALGVGLLTVVRAPWQLYVAFFVMSFGWATMNGAAISAILAPWFEKKRGLAISLALNGGSGGGVVVTPLLAFLIARYGFATGVGLAVAAMLIVLMPVALLVLKRRPEDVGSLPDGASPGADGAIAPVRKTAPVPWRRRDALHDRAFLTISIPFVLGFLAQVGFLTHQITYLFPLIGMQSAALAVSLTTVAAVVGRTVTGAFIDRLDRRLVSCAIFLIKAAALAILLGSDRTLALYVACILFGIAVGNTNTLPPLLVQQEFPQAHFSRVVSLVVSVNHVAFAVGPLLLGTLRDWTGDYRLPFTACIALDIAAAFVVLLGRRGRPTRGWSCTPRERGTRGS
jgi:MFS family permease